MDDLPLLLSMTVELLAQLRAEENQGVTLDVDDYVVSSNSQMSKLFRSPCTIQI